MNTVKKGNQFEEKSLEIIENLKENGLFGVKEFLNIIPKAKCYSELRKGEIEFDLVIEFKPPNADRPMMTYFIECKNYGKRVPVEQVQKFHSDITQVSGVNAKGIIISNGPFQKSAYNFAESTGMMVIEGESVENFKIIHYKRSSENESSIPFIKELINHNLLDDGLRSMEKLIDGELLNLLTKANSNITYGIDRLSRDDIDEISKEELDKINQDLLIQAYGLSVKELSEFIENEYGIEIQHFAPKENKYLGTCDIDNKIIGISKKIVDTPRELFVLGHEFGHYILHQRLAINQELMNSFSDSKYDFSIGKNRLENPRHWVEWQANYFSASLILPRTSIVAKTWQYSNSKSNLVFDDNYSNQKKFRRIIERLANHFNVSKTSVIYRLKELNMITDNTNMKSIGELISQWKSEYFA
ncbi:ImmA/IrrE family metallo-endopeptidase [Winogradskyella sp. ECml5-4]|uniref:ImmA/IrrE family metallo-endopeptidase n=1 Tax=Winogradskyella sp. ECml5-4 TaxID=3110975 RepID=UPI002FF42965